MQLPGGGLLHPGDAGRRRRGQAATAIGCCRSGAELTFLVEAPGPHRSVGKDCGGGGSAGGNGDHACEAGNLGRCRDAVAAFVEADPVTQRAEGVGAPGKNRAVSAQDEREFIAGRDRNRIGNPRHRERDLAAGGRSARLRPDGAALAEIAGVVIAPCQHGSVGEQRMAAFVAGRDRDHVREPGDRCSGRSVVSGPVTELPLGVVAPGHHGPVVEQRQPVFIAPVDLGDPGQPRDRGRDVDAEAFRVAPHGPVADLSVAL